MSERSSAGVADDGKGKVTPVASILFVDDEVAVLESLKRSLRREPFVIHVADSGRKALEMLQTTPVDLVVSDERMPGMSGAEFLTQVRERFPRTVRILMTGSASLQEATRAIDACDIYRFLSKPVAPDMMARTIHNAIQMRGLIDTRDRLHTEQVKPIRRL